MKQHLPVCFYWPDRLQFPVINLNPSSDAKKSMALILSPLTLETILFNTLHIPSPRPCFSRRSPARVLAQPRLATEVSLLQLARPLASKRIDCHAVVEMGGEVPVAAEGEEEVDSEFVIPSHQNEVRGEMERVPYDWTREWYPLYLDKDVPEDAPLCLHVFDKQLVLYRNGNGSLSCFDDRCPHRLAKLSEGQLIDGRLECLYHGWQFDGEGKCVRIPQLPADATIPRSACLKAYEVRESQGVVWVWMSQTAPPNSNKIPWFENFARPGFQVVSSIHELPYDHSVLIENLLDPAHVPISHDRTDRLAKREDAQPLFFEVTERTDRGFAGWWGRERDRYEKNFLRFDAPSVVQNNTELVDKKGAKQYYSGVFLCRPSGQGKCTLIIRFGSTKLPWFVKLLPEWFLHQHGCKVFEQDMGFLSSQSSILRKEKLPTINLYINLRSSDIWVAEYRQWLDKVGHGMPYYVGQNTMALPKEPAVVEHAPAGLVASLSASLPSKGGDGSLHVPNHSNRYFRHVVHCKVCRDALKAFQSWKTFLSFMAIVSTGVAILVTGRQWKGLFLFVTASCLAGVYVCTTAIAITTTNFIRRHRR